MPPKKPKVPPWKDSPARTLLYNLIADGQIEDGDDPKEVYDTHCKDADEFKPYPFSDTFIGRLKRLLLRIKEKDSQSARDATALVHDRQIFAQPTQDVWGEPMWQGSVAQEKLMDDIEAGKHLELLPRFLHATRDEYKVYALERFRDRIYQECKKMKREAFLFDKTEKKREKQLAKLKKYNLA
ncbi:hypothetical protein SEMRO_292_G109770.1 [Seminavis robusta]|uniref:Uncharacterized protein n=1 Tax=Seminavis robusta TaxID=568900 RepID=A0A9N8H9U3_9STRA|nr:hypothetical protein SEMRO_292_G109770.1 [Seminavis robusta]|eukprot:Sro292_g109770.1 n/a (183) ;mRNA; f:77982-78530